MLKVTKYVGTVEAKYSLFGGESFFKLSIDDPRRNLVNSVSSGDKNQVWEVRNYGVKKVRINKCPMMISPTDKENLPDGYALQVDALMIQTNLVGERAVVLIPNNGAYDLLTEGQKIKTILEGLGREASRFAIYVDTQEKILYSVKSIYMDYDELMKYWQTLVCRSSLPLIFVFENSKEEAFFMTRSIDNKLEGKRSSLLGTKLCTLCKSVLNSL